MPSCSSSQLLPTGQPEGNSGNFAPSPKGWSFSTQGSHAATQPRCLPQLCRVRTAASRSWSGPGLATSPGVALDDRLDATGDTAADWVAQLPFWERRKRPGYALRCSARFGRELLVSKALVDRGARLIRSSLTVVPGTISARACAPRDAFQRPAGVLPPRLRGSSLEITGHAGGESRGNWRRRAKAEP